jgi:HEAT repeat protein
VPELVKLLKSPKTQRDACLALGAIGSPSMKPLVKALNAEDPVTRAGAVSALGECFAPSLGNDRNDAELEAIRVEGRVVLPPILQCLGDEDSGVRLSALNALGGIELEQETIVQSVARSLGDSNPAVRRAATIALARHRDAATAQVPLLVEKLKDPDHSVAEGAAFAIRLIVPDKAEELGAR